MSEEEINVAIAECCGWRIASRVPPEVKVYATLCWVRPGGDEWQEEQIPNYCGDLNAMHEAFKHLGRHWEVSQVHDGYYCRIQFGPWGRDVVVAGLELGLVMAEAFLRTLGKWRD